MIILEFYKDTENYQAMLQKAQGLCGDFDLQKDFDFSKELEIQYAKEITQERYCARIFCYQVLLKIHCNSKQDALNALQKWHTLLKENHLL